MLKILFSIAYHFPTMSLHISGIRVDSQPFLGSPNSLWANVGKIRLGRAVWELFPYSGWSRMDPFS